MSKNGSHSSLTKAVATVGSLGTGEVPKFVLVGLMPCRPIEFVENGGLLVWNHNGKRIVLPAKTKLRFVSYLDALYV